LDRTALGHDWLEASRRALTVPAEVVLPLSETMYFPPDQPTAVGYRFDVSRGRVISLDVSIDADPETRLFVDLFEASQDGEPRRVTSLAPEETSLTFEVEADGTYILRAQPELLRGGRVQLVTRTMASLPFPVPSLASRRVQSGFGATRDAGGRLHEGIDIFAPARTPVVAVTSGLARPGSNRLGGTVVWLEDLGQRRRSYYAHLERAAIDGPARVEAGEVVGFIGNTGNARTTAPHLHFGLYAGGAIDPLPFVAADQDAPALVDLPMPPGQLARATPATTDLRTGPRTSAGLVNRLPRHTVFVVAGATGSFLRIRLPDGTSGYIPRRSAAVANTALQRRRIPAGTTMWDRPAPSGVAVTTADEAMHVEVLGRYAEFELVRLSGARTGWVRMSETT
jgi:hypothetical protein